MQCPHSPNEKQKRPSIIPLLIQIIDKAVLVIAPPPAIASVVAAERHARVPPSTGKKTRAGGGEDDKHVLRGSAVGWVEMRWRQRG